jgi:hypothetical protein
VVKTIRVTPSADRTAVTYPAELEFMNVKDQKTGRWMINPGMTITANIEVNRREGVPCIHSQAVNFTPSKILNQPPKAPDERVLWTLDQNNNPRAEVVKVGISGPRANGEASSQSTLEVPYTEILSDRIHEGDKVIIGEPVVVEKKGIQLPF